MIRDIQVLRALAIMLVIYAHLGFLFTWSSKWYQQTAPFINGWTGVDLFFVISGFVISRELLAIKQSNSTTLFTNFAVPFWLKRAFRILPSAWFWATFGMIAAFAPTIFVGAGTVFNDFFQWLTILLQLGNVYYASCIPACGASDSVFYTVYWSLGLEEQFYLVLPIVIWYASRKQLIVVLSVLIAVQFFIHRPQVPLNSLWYFRSDGLAWGVLIAIANTYPERLFLTSKLMSNFPARACVFTMLVILLVGMPSTGLPMATGLVAAMGAALVYLGSKDRNYFSVGPVLSPVLEWIGGRSFGIYLIHLPAFGLTHWILSSEHTGITIYKDKHTLLFVGVAFCITCCLSEANYQLLEKPFRRYGRKWATEVQATP